MTNQRCSSENIKNKTYLEQENVYKNSLKEQYFEIEHWKLKIEMISNMKSKETQKKKDQLIEMKNLQDKVNKKRMENCDYVHNCIQNGWLASLENNFEILTQKKEFEKSNSNISYISQKLEDELNEMKSILGGLNLIRYQVKQLTELTNKINDIEHSIGIWDDEILKIEKVRLT